MTLPALREPFLLLDRHTGFDAALLDRVSVSDEVTLAPIPGTARPLVDAAGSFGGLALPTGIAVDPDGAIYVLDGADATLKRFDPCDGVFVTLPCIGGVGSEPRQFSGARGIGISPRGDLIVADTGNARVQVFALKGLVLRAIWLSPDGSWEPRDIAVGPDCRVYVSDPAGEAIHVFDPAGRVLGRFDATGPATDIALDGAGRLYVVRQGADDVLVLSASDGGVLGTVTAPAELAGRFCPLLVSVDPDGVLHVGDAAGGIYRCGGGEVRACAWIGVAPTALAFDLDGNLLVGSGGGVSVVSGSRRVEVHGALVTAPLDSLLDAAQWHAVELEGEVPSGTAIEVQTFSTQDLLTSAQLAALPESAWAGHATAAALCAGEPWRALVLSPRGRYLSVRLILTGDGAATPSLRTVRVFYPRNSSLRHLPSVYRDDPLSADFLDRFLSNFDATWERIEHTLTDVPAYLDPCATPAEPDRDFLSWLATWLGITFERGWPIARRRALLACAPTLFKLRGTVEGIRLQIRLCTGVEAHVLEHFKLRRLLFLGESRLGADSELWGPSMARRLQLDAFSRIGSFELRDDDDPLHDPFGYYANQFTVFVTRRPGVDTAAVQRVLADAAPAHTLGQVALVEPRMRIGTHAFIGLDTVVGSYPEGIVEGQGVVGQDTVLGPSCDSVPPTLSVGNARVGTTSQID